MGIGDKYSVCQYFRGEDDATEDSYEYVRRGVSAEDALSAFAHYTTSVAAKMGITSRVIITDQNDDINLEWVFGKGVTFAIFSGGEGGISV